MACFTERRQRHATKNIEDATAVRVLCMEGSCLPCVVQFLLANKSKGNGLAFYHIVRPSWPAFDHNCDLHEIHKSG